MRYDDGVHTQSTTLREVFNSDGGDRAFVCACVWREWGMRVGIHVAGGRVKKAKRKGEKSGKVGRSAVHRRCARHTECGTNKMPVGTGIGQSTEGEWGWKGTAHHEPS